VAFIVGGDYARGDYPRSNGAPNSMWSGKISALVLTYNRREILARCLHATLTQSEPPDEIIVLDNGSTDGTCEFLGSCGLLDNVVLYRQSQNTGPAAGIEALFRLAMERGSDWIWFMDDDTIPDVNALRELKHAYTENFSSPQDVGFLRSFVVFPDGSPYHLPPVDVRHEKGTSPAWADRLHAGLVRMRWCQLNSMLIPRTTISRVGYVSSLFYFAGEDHDFTIRVTEVLPGYLVGKSRATHLQTVTGVFSVVSEKDPQRIRLGKLYYRNNIYFRWRLNSFYRMLGFILKALCDAGLALGARDHRLLRFYIILQGIVSGVIFIFTYRETGAHQNAEIDRPTLVSEPSARTAAVARQSESCSLWEAQSSVASLT
jgi:GT2 family glycosyltransferase